MATSLGPETVLVTANFQVATDTAGTRTRVHSRWSEVLVRRPEGWRQVAAAREPGSYRLEELLGQGGMDEVWRAL